MNNKKTENANSLSFVFIHGIASVGRGFVHATYKSPDRFSKSVGVIVLFDKLIFV